MQNSKLFLDLEFKEIDVQARLISGWVSTPAQDCFNDIVLPEAFEEPFRLKPYPPVLFQHDIKNVIGRVTKHKIDPIEGLWVEAKISKTVGKEWELIKEGVLRNFSFGFSILKSHEDTLGRRIIEELDLWEVSVVGVPANAEAEILAVTGKTANLREIGSKVYDISLELKKDQDDLVLKNLKLSIVDIATQLSQEQKELQQQRELISQLENQIH